MKSDLEKKAKCIAIKELSKEKIEIRVVQVLMALTIFSGFILLFLVFSQVGLTGYSLYVGSIDSSAGTITEVNIDGSMSTDYWAGIYGLAFRLPDFYDLINANYVSGQVSRKDLFFSCLQEDVVGGNEIFASPSPEIDFSSLRAATVEEVDAFMGCEDKKDCAANTLTEEMDVYLGSRLISNIPSSFSTKADGSISLFDFGALHDGDNLVFVSHIGSIESTFGDEEVINYQMLLPIPKGSEIKYYFFTDPNDVCPQGGGTGDSIVASVFGKVLDEGGESIENVLVSVSGAMDYSDAQGNYNLSFESIPGEYNLFAKGEGYDDYFSTINFSLSNNTIEKNIFMNYSTPGKEDVIETFFSGFVRDSRGNPVSEAYVFFGNEYVQTNSDGSFVFDYGLLEGNYSLSVIKEGYRNANEFFYISNSSREFHQEIVLELINENLFETGPYEEEPTEGEYKIEPTVGGVDYWVSSKQITKQVNQNTFVQEVIGIYNLGEGSMNLRFKLSPELQDIVELEKTTASISPQNAFELNLDIYGLKEVGVYEGVLTISGDMDQEVPIRIEIMKKDFSIESMLMEVSLFSEIVEPGKEIRYKLSLQNLLRSQDYSVDVEVELKDFEGNETFASDNYTMNLQSSSSVIKNMHIQDNLSNGDYLLEFNAKYLDKFSMTSVPVVVARPIYMYSFFGIPLWLMATIISFLSFISLGFFTYKRYKDRKKRYRIQLEYSTLPQPGPRVVKLGHVAETKHPAYYEIDKLTTHGIVAGATGMGKSISAQVLIEECLMNNVAVVVFDPTAQWSGMLRKCDDKKMMGFYPKFGLKPKDARAFKGNVRMIKDSKQKLDINKYIAPGQIQIFSMNKLTPSEIDIFVSNVIKQIFRSDPKEAPQLKVLLVFDEVHRLLPKFGGSGAGFLQIERACREFRKWGLGVMLISQVLNDFAGQIKANINTELQTRTLEEGDLERIKTKYGEEFLKSLVRAEVGVVMFQNADYNRGRPYFVNFRPILHSTRRLEDTELEKYNKFNDAVDDLEFQIEGLEEEKVDVFDLKMELKLVKDKIMSGSFSVVEIYLEGLVPRVKKEWEKLGKPLPERKIEFVDEGAMEEEDKKTKIEKEKEEAEEKVKKVEEKFTGEKKEENKKEKKSQGKGDVGEKEKKVEGKKENEQKENKKE